MLGQQLQSDLTAAMKTQDQTRVSTLRLLMAAVKNKQIELGRPLEEAELVSVVQKEVKQRQDSIAQFEGAGRADLATSEQAELEILSAYLPEQMGDDQVAAEVEQAIQATGASSMADMGKVMAALGHLKGQADMGKVSSLVKAKLG